MLDDRWLARQILDRGLASQEEIDAALTEEGKDLCSSLVIRGAVQESDILRFLGLHFQTRYITAEKLSTAKIPQWVLELLPLDFCEQQKVLPVRFSRERSLLSLVTCDPSRTEVIDQVKKLTAASAVQAYVALSHAVEAAIRKLYRGDIHAFTRVDQSVRQSYSELLDMYEQRLIEFSSEEESQPSPSPKQQPSLLAPSSPSESLEHLTQEGATSSIERASLQSLQARLGVGLSWETFIGIIEVLVCQLEKELGWRKKHSVGVAKLAVQVANQAGMSPTEVRYLHLAALLHEIGKPPSEHLSQLALTFFSSPRKLAEAHCREPVDLLEDTNLPAEVLAILEALYERIDGSGVPGKISGDDVPIGSLILAVVDAFEDLLSNSEAPGGRCEDKGAALRRLREAAKIGYLCPRSVELLSHVITGDALRDRIMGNRRMVLLVDPDAQTTTELEKHLAEAGHDVITATNSATAARRLLSEEIDIIVAETDLKPVDGLDLLARLRADERTYTIPFVFLSTRSESDLANRALDLGAADFLTKPVHPELLTARMKQILAHITPKTAVRRGICGSLTEMGLPDIITALSVGRKTGRLTLQLGDKQGEIFMEKGEMVQAVYGDKRGESAFFEMVKLTRGEFALNPARHPLPQRTITRSTEELLNEVNALTQGAGQ